MRKDFGAKAWLYPQPVLIIASYDENGTPDAMNAAWGGTHDYEEIAMCLSAGHKTVKNILKRKAFTVSPAVAEAAAECDYLGLVSANDVPDKLEHSGLHTVKSEKVDAPVIAELPMTFECELKSYDPESGIMVGKVVNVSADESILTDGVIDLAKYSPITFDAVHNTYVRLGTVAGKAFCDGLKFK